jgi:hypothetical protein
MHGDAADVVLAQLDLAGMQARPNVDADAGQFIAKRGRAVDRPSGAVEGGQDAVAGSLEQRPPNSSTSRPVSSSWTLTSAAF